MKGKHPLSIDRAEPSIDVGFFGKLLLEEANAEPSQGALEGFDSAEQLHLWRVDSGAGRRNLVETPPELIR